MKLAEIVEFALNMASQLNSPPELKEEEKKHGDAKVAPETTSMSDEPKVEDIGEARRTVESYTDEEAARILRKVDYRLVPLLAVLYLLAFIDRGNSTSLSIFIPGLNEHVVFTSIFFPTPTGLSLCGGYFIMLIRYFPVANAKIAGMEDDLQLHGSQYNIALTLFFVPYGLFEVPSNIVLKMLRPSVWISIMMLSWGIVMT